ncbi:MAG: hypothetical protein WCW87_02430 [Candidatus Paceibacterota bacterium]
MNKSGKNRGFISTIIAVIIGIVIFIYFNDEIKKILANPIVKSFFVNFLKLMQIIWVWVLDIIKLILVYFNKFLTFVSHFSGSFSGK